MDSANDNSWRKTGYSNLQSGSPSANSSACSDPRLYAQSATPKTRDNSNPSLISRGSVLYSLQSSGGHTGGIKTTKSSYAAFDQQELEVKGTQILDLTSNVTLSKKDIRFYGGESDVYYAVLERHGKGGKVTSIPVAVKVSRRRKDESPECLKKRSKVESGFLNSFDHPNIVKFYGECTLDASPALVMQWCEQGTITEYAQTQSSFRKLCLVNEVCKAIQYLHGLEPPIVHRDLKGANILVDDNGHAVVIDFGLSTNPGRALSLEGRGRWTAPEIIITNTSGDNFLASDVWSLACTINEILSGHIPYRQYRVLCTVLSAIIGKRQRPAKPEDMLVARSLGLVDLLEKCWSFNPQDRPSMDEVVAILGAVAHT